MRRSYVAQEIAEQLRKAEDMIASGSSVAETARLMGVKYGTLYQWRRKYAGGAPDSIKRIKELEAENARLRKALQELESDAIGVFPQMRAKR